MSAKSHQYWTTDAGTRIVKWYARLAVQALLLETLEEIDPQWPAATFDVEAEKARLAAT